MAFILGIPDATTNLQHGGRYVQQRIWPIGITYNKGISVRVLEVTSFKTGGGVEVYRFRWIGCTAYRESIWKFFLVLVPGRAYNPTVFRFQRSHLYNIRYASDRVEEHVIVGTNSICDSIPAEDCCNLNWRIRLDLMCLNLLGVWPNDLPFIQSFHLVESILLFDGCGR